jgi:hypothetical protein
MGRLAHTIVLVVFALTAADPTPRFLGMNRLPTAPTPAQVPQPKIRTVLPTFELPAALSQRGASSVETDAPVLARPAGPTFVSIALAHFAGGRGRSPVASPRLSERNGAGPPLRC